jgi:NAD(P)H-dependent FMN reductase
MGKLQIIVASTRESRSADRVTPWINDRATRHGAFDVELLDLRDWPLPMFQEFPGSIVDIAAPVYSEPIVKQWNEKIAEADAYLFITAEYNHSIPGALKNAIDSVYVSWAFRNKPAAFVGYSVAIGAGSRAVEHLAQIATELEVVPLRNTVLIPRVTAAFDENHDPVDETQEAALEIMLDDLAWWSNSLAHAREHGELPPGIIRQRAAAEARAAAAKTA